MDNLRKTRIIIPCYNESTRLNPKTFLDALDRDKELSFLFVNDGSTDTTLNIIQTMKEINPTQVEIMSLEINSGKAEAVRLGMLSAVNERFDYVGYWDADLATPLEVIDRFCHVLDSAEVDLVIGSRVRLLGRKVERRAIRHYLGRLFATCASILLDICIYDTQCGAKIFRNSDSLRLVFGKPFTVTWIFDVEMLARFPIVLKTSPAEASSRWVEYPLDKWVDVRGSKIKNMDFIRCGLELCKLWYYFYPSARTAYVKYLLNENNRLMKSSTAGFQ